MTGSDPSEHIQTAHAISVSSRHLGLSGVSSTSSHVQRPSSQQQALCCKAYKHLGVIVSNIRDAATDHLLTTYQGAPPCAIDNVDIADNKH
eukprot:jgi/Chrzof1/14901/Cz09g20020.t1